MNQPFDVEELLRQLPLRQPTAALDRRVLGAPRVILVAVAAGLLLALVPTILLYAAMDFQKRGTLECGNGVASAAASGEITSLEYESNLVTYEGLVGDDDGQLMRVYRIQALRGNQWDDTANGVTIEETVPTEHVAFVAAPIQ